MSRAACRVLMSCLAMQAGSDASSVPLRLRGGANAPSSSDALPPGWRTAVDPASGRTYYWNVSSRETTWVPPKAPPSDSTLPPPATPPPPTAVAADGAPSGEASFEDLEPTRRLGQRAVQGARHLKTRVSGAGGAVAGIMSGGGQPMEILVKATYLTTILAAGAMFL